MRRKNAFILVAAYCISLILLAGCGGQKYPDLPQPVAAPVIEVNQRTFDQYIKSAGDRPAIVVFYKDRTKNSQEMLRRMENFSNTYGGAIGFYKFPVIKGSIADRYKIITVPTTVLFKQGREVDRIKGIPSDPQLLAAWDQDLELWLLKTALHIDGDQYSGKYKYMFNNSSTLEMSNY